MRPRVPPRARHALASPLPPPPEPFASTLQQALCPVPRQVFIGHCHGHIRNFIIKGMMNAATEKLKLLLEDDLSEFSSFERMSVNAMDLILAAYKEFHPGGAYAKGKGREFLAWVKAHFPKEMWIPILRAAGSRQDMSFDGAVPLFADRKILMEFLRSLLVPGSDNTLESFLYGVLRCNEMVALLRVLTLFDLVWSRPMRFLNGAASSLDDWGSDNSAEVLDLTEKMMVAIAADGHALLDPSLDPCAASTLTPNPNPHPNPHPHPNPNPNPHPHPNQACSSPHAWGSIASERGSTQGSAPSSRARSAGAPSSSAACSPRPPRSSSCPRRCSSIGSSSCAATSTCAVSSGPARCTRPCGSTAWATWRACASSASRAPPTWSGRGPGLELGLA